MLQQDRQTVEKEVREILADQFNQDSAETFKLENNLHQEYGADSLDMVELAMLVEDEFELNNVSNADVETWKTGTDIVDYVLKRMKED